MPIYVAYARRCEIADAHGIADEWRLVPMNRWIVETRRFRCCALRGITID